MPDHRETLDVEVAGEIRHYEIETQRTNNHGDIDPPRN